ncbi:hypothetical protein U0L90_07860 [Flavobacteriaceae sp. LMIT009]
MRLRKINSETYHSNTSRYELVPGTKEGAPLCPYGNHYKWIGYDKNENEFVRMTKSVFKKLIDLKD